MANHLTFPCKNREFIILPKNELKYFMADQLTEVCLVSELNHN